MKERIASAKNFLAQNPQCLGSIELLLDELQEGKLDGFSEDLRWQAECSSVLHALQPEGMAFLSLLLKDTHEELRKVAAALLLEFIPRVLA